MLNAKQIEAIEVLAIGGKTYIDMASDLGIDVVTLRTWRKDPEFSEAVIKRARELLKDALPDIYSSLVREARKGNFNHIRLVLEHLERLEMDPLARVQDSYTFTWKVHADV